MIEKFITTLLRGRHFWRYASFSEVAELYASRTLRMLAINMTAAFTSIFLYQQGYGVFFIALFWAAFYFFKFLISMPSAAFVARFGPKHSTFISNILFIPAMIALALVPTYGVWLLSFMILFQGASTMIYQVAYGVNFSKVKSVEHAGKEIAYMNILEKITTGLSPLIGGILAYLLGPEVVILIAAALFTVAAIPLFRSGEPVLSRQKLSFKGLPWHLVTKNITSQMAIGFDVFTSGTVWTLFTAITIIGIASNNEIYAANGLLLSVVLISALAASYAYGRLIDRRRGLELLKIASIANSLTHLLRPFIGTPVAIAGLNVANEAATTGYTMSYTRGFFDNADLSGQRTTYIGIIDAISNLGAAVGALLLAILVSFLGDVRAMEYFFYITAAVVLLVMTARFPLYRK